MRIRILIAVVLTAQVALAQTKSKITVTDLTRISQVGDVELSPDGSQALYTLTTIEPGVDSPGVDSPGVDSPGVDSPGVDSPGVDSPGVDSPGVDSPGVDSPNPDQPGEYEYRTHIYRTDLTNGSRALTYGSESAKQARWSPDGRQIAFVRSVKGKGQVFVLPLRGGEAYQLTHLSYGASDPRWSPDGKRIAFSVTVPMADMLTDSLLNPGKRLPPWSLEKPGFSSNNFVKPNSKTKPDPDGSLAEIRAYLAKDVVDKKAKVINRLNFLGESTTEPDPTFTQLYVVDVRDGATAVAAQCKPLTRGFTSTQGGEWLPGGQGLLAVMNRDSTQHPDRELDNAIVFIPADGSGLRITVLAEAGKTFIAPHVSPDGRLLVFLTSPSAGVNFPQLGLATLNNTKASAVQLIDFDRSAGGLRWATMPTLTGKKAKPNAVQTLYFTAPTNGGVPLYRLDPSTRQVIQLTGIEQGVTGFDVVGNRVVFAKTEVANPSELYTATVSDVKNATKITEHNSWVAQRQLSYPEKQTFKNSLGQEVDYWIMKPTGLKNGGKHPLLLNMHGGPTAMWGPGEASMWHEFQYMTAQGYGIVYANPRGSGGYGLAFQRANVNDWGTGPTEDVLTAATSAAKEPWADTSRQVITGGSYAGYLTAWIVGHDNRFKAAFAQRGVYDLTTFMGEANAWRLVPNYFAYPWEADAKVLDANSPYSFVQNINTPLLIKHGENDLRTGVSQSEMLYKSLKILGRPVEYVRMPGATHELSRSGNVRQRIDRLLRIYEFFERYVGDDTPASTGK